MKGVVAPSGRQTAAKAALGALALCLLSMGVGGWKLVKVRGEVAELKGSKVARATRLAEDRRVAATAPKAVKPAALDRSRAVSSLRSSLTRLASEKGFTVEEFQALAEENPFLTAYASDNNDPGWFQVTVKVSLRGRAPTIMAALASLRSLDVPFEVDNMELTRRSTDTKGVSEVAAGIAMRVLVYRGEE